MLLRQLPQRRLPLTLPFMPDTGTPFQLVHHDDVAQALVKATLGEGEPGAYNLAGEGTITLGDLARALGWLALPVPGPLVDVAALATRLPLMPSLVQWINAVRVPVLMDTTKARTRLGWEPRAHHSRDAEGSRQKSVKWGIPLTDDVRGERRRCRGASPRSLVALIAGSMLAAWVAGLSIATRTDTLAPMSPLVLRRLPRRRGRRVGTAPRPARCRSAAGSRRSPAARPGSPMSSSTPAPRSTRRSSARTRASRRSPRSR